MDLADPTAHLALAYVSALQRQSYRPTVAEFNAYVEGPDQRPGTTRTIRRPSTVQSPAGSALRAIADLNVNVSRSLQRALGPLQGTSGLGGKSVEVHEPGEAMIDYLRRLKWVRVTSGRVHITPIGEAVLTHLEQEMTDTEAPLDIALDQDDPVAKARLIGRINEIGKCDLVDAYLRLDDLFQILNSTEVERVLTRPAKPGDNKRIVELETLMGSLALPRPFEVRTSDEFHDRYVIPDSGPIWQLGTSLGGVGVRFSAMVRITDDKLAKHIRDRFESAWKTGRPLKPAPTPSPPSAKSKKSAAPASGKRARQTKPRARSGSSRRKSSSS
jgi:hypothetical protein